VLGRRRGNNNCRTLYDPYAFCTDTYVVRRYVRVRVPLLGHLRSYVARLGGVRG
jgi:hypothetical protein